MLSTVMPFGPSEPAPSAHADATVGAVFEIIVGAIVGEVIGGVIAITLTTIHTVGTSSAPHRRRKKKKTDRQEAHPGMYSPA